MQPSKLSYVLEHILNRNVLRLDFGEIGIGQGIKYPVGISHHPTFIKLFLLSGAQDAFLFLVPVVAMLY